MQIDRIGYGQVEVNHMSAQATGQIYAQLPAADVFGGQLENGQFVKYDYAANEVNLTGKGEWMMVYCEEKLYDPRFQAHKDFVYREEDFTDKKMYPRLFRVENGDIFTTNTFTAKATSNTGTTTGIDLNLGDEVTVDPATGFLVAGNGGTDRPTFQVGKVYTMPDGQPGVKLQKIS